MFLGTTTDTNRVSHETVTFPHPANHNDTSEFDFSDPLEDDAIIAAANASALENDDEGFYGREFGFFAHASASAEAEYANGGYFGTRSGADGLIGRSHSGRVNFQEPSLTPITERSEWSNRTSTISLAMYGHQLPHSSSQGQVVASPGLAQLADMMQHEDDSMSLSALLKLRRGAWGGSNGSLRSSAGGSQQSGGGGSPLSHFPPANGPLANVGVSHLPTSGSGCGVGGERSPLEASPPASPTVVSQSLPVAPALHGQGQVQAQAQAQSQFLDLHLATTGGVEGFGAGAGRSKGQGQGQGQGLGLGQGRGHSRNSSVGGESVSYVQDVDEDGVGRWWLETRRVGEGGEGVVVGRRVVEGGRI